MTPGTLTLRQPRTDVRHRIGLAALGFGLGAVAGASLSFALGPWAGAATAYGLGAAGFAVFAWSTFLPRRNLAR